MLASLCPRDFDPLAPLQFIKLASSSDLDSVSRRVSRVATLDQSAAFYDAGYSDADRTIVLALGTSDRTFVDTAKWFAKMHSLLTIATREGCFTCAIEYVRFQDDLLTIRLLVKAEAT